MKVAYVTPYNARSLEGSNIWSGTGYHIAESLKRQSLDLVYIGPLENKIHSQLVQKYKRYHYKLFRKRYLDNATPCLLKSFAKQIESKLSKTNADIIISASANPIAYLECSQPMVFWADASFASLQDFYPEYSQLCDETARDWHRAEKLAHEKCRLAIYSSSWAAKDAIQHYGIDESKVEVIPFGANITSERSTEQVEKLIEERPSDKCKLLFLSVDWHRKGGGLALDVAKALNQSGLRTELTIVGCYPPSKQSLPEFVNALGYISKSTAKGKERIAKLIADAHFLILPSLADCTPIVFCEANSLGVPCLTTNVGGIPTIIKDNLNGKKFDVGTSSLCYRDYILGAFSHYQNYIDLAFSSFHEYKSRLNWQTSGKSVKKLISEI